jgi:hypothetical protein
VTGKQGTLPSFPKREDLRIVLLQFGTLAKLQKNRSISTWLTEAAFNHPP